MAHFIYTYMCCNGACRNIEKKGGVKQSMIKCPKCGKNMRLTSTEKKG